MFSETHYFENYNVFSDGNQSQAKVSMDSDFPAPWIQFNIINYHEMLRLIIFRYRKPILKSFALKPLFSRCDKN